MVPEREGSGLEHIGNARGGRIPGKALSWPDSGRKAEMLSATGGNSQRATGQRGLQLFPAQDRRRGSRTGGEARGPARRR